MDKKKTIAYTVDDEDQTTTEHKLSARQILEKAGVDPTSHYLMHILGHAGKERKSYKDHPDEIIELHDGMKFVSVSTGPTTVS